MTQRKIFFTSDTHFSHTNVIKFANRPFANSREMDETMIANWNKTVSPSDIVWHLGDTGFARTDDLIKILNRLNGEKHLVWGNHDKNLQGNAWRKVFQTAQDIKHLKVPAEVTGTGAVQEIVLCHYAMRVWNKSHYGAWHLFGHSHGTLPDDPNSLSCDVGVDCWGFTPVSFEQIKKVMEQKTFKPLDHHR